jgi:hypothetical protein
MVVGAAGDEQLADAARITALSRAPSACVILPVADINSNRSIP